MLATLPRKVQLTETFIRLKQLRESRDMSQGRLSELADIPAGTIAAWDSGRVQALGIENVRKLARAFDTTPELLLGYLGGNTGPDSTAAKLPEPYESLGAQSVPVTMVRVAEVTIAAGLEAWRTLVYSPVPSEIVGSRRDVILVRVTGECMEPEIEAGDMALIDRENLSPRTGAMVAVLLEDGQLVMKRFSISPDDGKPILTDNKGTTIRPNGAKIVGTIIHVSRTVY